MEEHKNGIKAIYRKTQADWRKWLAENHQTEHSVWLILYKKDSPAHSFSHQSAVDEALCYGWIDSLTQKRDEESRYQLFSRRKPKSNWSAINKDKALKMIEKRLMADAGLQSVQVAKDNGMWDALNDVENLVVPEDLGEKLFADKIAWDNWNSFPRSSKKAILKWITEAKKAETREVRILETIKAARENTRVK
ncbi:MAG: YdeI/OmpD-associated family protein [Mucilaginibacter sp.]